MLVIGAVDLSMKSLRSRQGFFVVLPLPSLFDTSGARATRERRAPLLVAGAVEDIICRVLRLGRSMNEEFAIIAEFLQPAGDVRGLILDYGV